MASSQNWAENDASSTQQQSTATSSAPTTFDATLFEECEQMVQMLQAKDLEQIISVLGISFTGRRTDLQSRILSLLRTNLELLAPMVQAQCNKWMYIVRINSQTPLHPDVRLKKLAFYEVLGTLKKPSTLVPRNTQRLQEVSFHFKLTGRQLTEIRNNDTQVQLRFCLVETSCDQEDCFPPNVNVKVNNKLLPPTNWPNVKPPRPVNVTPNVKLSPRKRNTITVQWCPDYTRSYCLALYLVRELTSAQLLHRLKTKGVQAADYTRALIQQKLTEDADCETTTTMLKVSLNCPLGKMKMSVPCRASTCSHLQCFDASLYLQMNERKPTWKCPVCYKPAIYDNLVIDGYFQDVLGSSLLKSDDTVVHLHPDGSWSTPSVELTITPSVELIII